ncbi:hypothetical protein N7470_003661 [Penicillium chermesinum]|nr:hypothetical protein N7470_003661 [Penicillium chermesinum]
MSSFVVSISEAIQYTPLQPPSYPLALGSPVHLSDRWPRPTPRFWSGDAAPLVWTVLARVDGTTYNLFGVHTPNDGTQPGEVTAATYTSTHSTFTVTAGQRSFTLDFFSPVSPKNLLRQSLPFSYLTVTLAAGDSHSVQVYSDIDSTWTGQQSDSTWSHSTNGSTRVFQITAVGTATYSQNAETEQALWGSAVYATRPGSGSSLSNQAGPLSTVRQGFIDNGTLTGSQASWTSDGVTGFAHDLGTTADQSAVTFAIGHVREESINYLGAAQTGYYRATYPETVDAVSYFLDDYDDANSESTRFDDLIQTTGSTSFGSNYSDILALSTRQVYGGIEIVIPNDSLDTSQTKAFIKEISSDGNINTVDVIYATFPIFYVLSPDYLRLLLTPIFDYQASKGYSESYAVHDLGANYPNATGHLESGESMPVEESGNLIILTYAYQAASEDTDLATTYSSQLETYAKYLSNNGLYPASQLSLNDALGALANQTNLGVKAATALAAYGKLVDDNSYLRQGRDWADQIWTDHLGTDDAGTRFLIQYGTNPWFLVFNHYADKLFGLDAFPEEAYNATSTFYPTVRDDAGVPLDGSLSWGQTNWQAAVAATVSGEARDILINDMWAYISNGLNDAPFSDRYWVKANDGASPGESYSFRARPTLGSHFSLAALSGANIWP